MSKVECPPGLVGGFERAGFGLLSVAPEHADRAPHHRDPVDRMLIAQAEVEATQIVTADTMIRQYDIVPIDARV